MSEQQPITVYGVMSPNVAKVVIVLEELELPYALRYVSLFKGEQFSAEILALNPLGKVPRMLDPKLDRPLAESGAILLWLAERQRALLPEGSEPYSWDATARSRPSSTAPWTSVCRTGNGSPVTSTPSRISPPSLGRSISSATASRPRTTPPSPLGARGSRAATQEDLDRFFGRAASMPTCDFTAVKRLQ